MKICGSWNAPEDIKRKACKWQMGYMLSDWTALKQGCYTGDADWCEYFENTYTYTYADVDLPSAMVSLASKGVTVESKSSNAGYYAAGASLVAAAAVAFAVMKKRDADDDFKV